MACKMDTDYIQKYIDNALDPLEEIIIQEHIKYCPDCKREFTQLKLLLWELKQLQDVEIEVPKEAAAVRENVLSRLDSINQGGLSIKDILKFQKQIYRNSRRYMKFIPGLDEGSELIRNGLRKAPSIIYMACKKALLKRIKPSIARSRV